VRPISSAATAEPIAIRKANRLKRSGDPLQQPGQDETRDPQQQHQGDQRLSHREGQRTRIGAHLPRQDRHGQQEWDETQVLEEQHAHRQLSVRHVDLVPLHQHPHGKGGARQRSEHAYHHRGFGTDPEGHGHRRHGGDGQADLERTGDRHRAPLAAQHADRQLEADLEEQQRHAQLGEGADPLRLGHEAQAAGPDDRSHHQEARDRGQAHALEDRRADRRGRDHQHDFEDEIGRLHAAMLTPPVTRRAAAEAVRRRFGAAEETT
jgi:hypothetical protein